MIIHGADIYTKDCRFVPGSLLIRGRRIAGIITEETKTMPQTYSFQTDSGYSIDNVIDASGCYAIPGLIDIHFHGCMGADFCDGTQEAIRILAEYEAAHGITAVCPATLTLPEKTLCHVIEEGAAFHMKQEESELREDGLYAGCADLVGINMEGPFISHQKKGAQNGDYIIGCDEIICKKFLDAGRGLVKIIGVAPEENLLFRSFISHMKGSVRLSLAHTNADYKTAKAAFDSGASHVVHLFNAMPEFLHRAPGVIGAAADSPGVTAEIICDGNHVHPGAVRGAFAMFGAKRIVLISDSLRLCGLGDGDMDLGGMRVRVRGTRACLASDGTLAGSVLNLMDCMRTASLEMGISLEDAVRCSTINPALVIGQEDVRGSLEEGKIADIVLLEKKDLSVRAVIKSGRMPGEPSEQV